MRRLEESITLHQLRCLILGALLLFACTTLVTANPLNERLVEAEFAQLDAAEQLLAQSRLSEGYNLADPRRFTLPEARIQARYLQAVALLKSGKAQEAARELRAILARFPDLERVRYTLALAQQALGNDVAARHNLELLLNDDTDIDVERHIRAGLASLKEDKRWSLSASLSVTPSTNINSGTDRAVVTIGGVPFTPAAASRRQSGVGLQYSVGLGYRLPLSDSVSATSQFEVSRRDYSGSSFDETNLNMSLGLLFQRSHGYWGVDFFSKQKFTNDPLRGTTSSTDDTGLKLYGRFLLGRSTRLEFSSSLANRDNLLNQRLTGNLYDTSLSIDRIVSSQTFIRGIIRVEQEALERADASFSDQSIGFGLYREWQHGFTTYAEASFAKRAYDGAFPLLGAPREDMRSSLLVRLSKRDVSVAGFSPFLQGIYTNNDSNVDLFDYDKTEVSFGLTKTF